MRRDGVTSIIYVGGYADVEAAEADYELVKDLHTKAGLIDAYDAAVIQRRDEGKVKIARKHETPTRVVGVLGGGVGLLRSRRVSQRRRLVT